MTTEYYVTVVELIEKLDKAENKEQYLKMLEDLKNKKEEIISIQKEIEAINGEVLEKLYPFDNISLKDKEEVHLIINRINKLSTYDREQILRYDDIVKAETQIDNLQRAVIIGCFLTFLALGMVVFVVLRMKKRKKEKNPPRRFRRGIFCRVNDRKVYSGV